MTEKRSLLTEDMPAGNINQKKFAHGDKNPDTTGSQDVPAEDEESEKE
jgi:hypothetical protein